MGEEYLVHQPADSSASFTVTLAAGTYRPRWFDIETRTWLEIRGRAVRPGSRTNFDL